MRINLVGEVIVVERQLAQIEAALPAPKLLLGKHIDLSTHKNIIKEEKKNFFV